MRDPLCAHAGTASHNSIQDPFPGPDTSPMPLTEALEFITSVAEALNVTFTGTKLNPVVSYRKESSPGR